MSTFEVDLVKDSTLKQTNAILAKRGGLEPESYSDVQAIVRLGLAPSVFSIGDIIEVGRETQIQASLGEHTGISAVSVNEDTFVAAMDEAGEKEYEIIYDGSAWKYEGHPIILADYGLSVTGTAAEGDTIIVVETASTIEMVVMDFIEGGQTPIGNIKIHDKAKQYGMILQSKGLLYNLQVDNTEAFYYNNTGAALPAGTYHVTLGDNYDTTYGGGATYQFTLAQALPAGGQIVWPWGYNQMCTNAKISTFADGNATTPIESNVVVSAGSGGTDLGTMLIAVQESAGLNSLHRMRYGSNKWSEGSMRQHLNSKKAAGQVYTAQSHWDRPPSWAANTAGFMHGLDPEFIKICADVELLTALSTAAGDTTTTEGNAGTGYETTVDKFFLPSRPEVFGGGDNASDKGTPWAFYKLNSDVPGGSSNSGNDSNRIKLNASGSPYYWWLRSPSVGLGHYVRYIDPAGSVNYGSAINSYGVAPACVIA